MNPRNNISFATRSHYEVSESTICGHSLPYLLLFFVVALITFAGCKHQSTAPDIRSNSALCYVKAHEDSWELFINDIYGSNLIDISNSPNDDDYPQWSPDGRYIAYSRSAPVNGPLIYIYDTQTKTSTNITTDGGGACLQPQWAPNGKLCISYPYFWAKYRGTYLMNPDGTDRKQILDSIGLNTHIYFCADSYTFLYVAGTEIFKSNIDTTLNEFVLELEPSPTEFLTIRDFNPVTREFLVNTNKVPGASSVIAKYNVETKQLNVFVNADSGFTVFLPRFSTDFSQIAFIEHSDSVEYLSVYRAGSKNRLVKLPTAHPKVSFSFVPMAFSPDGRYIAFSKQVFNSGEWVSWTDYLYAVDVYTGQLQSIDLGRNPCWNPRF